MIEIKILIDDQPDNYTNTDEVIREIMAAIEAHEYGIGDEGRVLGVRLHPKLQSVKVREVRPRRGKKL